MDKNKNENNKVKNKQTNKYRLIMCYGYNIPSTPPIDAAFY
jgi:hypothetical protein